MRQPNKEDVNGKEGTEGPTGNVGPVGSRGIPGKLPPYAKASLAALKEAHARHNQIDAGLLFAVLDALVEAESKE